MKRVAIVAFHHAELEASGGMRSRALERLLPDNGWTPVIITVGRTTADLRDAEPTHIHVESRTTAMVARLMLWSNQATTRSALPARLWRWLTYRCVAVPDRDRIYLRRAQKAAVAAHRLSPFDAIISTSGPPSAHRCARRIARRLGIPWIADYRDLWTGNPYVRHGPLRRAMEHAMERRVWANASALTATAPGLATEISRRSGRHVEPIYTGQPNMPAKIQPPTSPWTIVHAGSLYGGRRDPQPIFDALHQLQATPDGAHGPVRVDFIGPVEPWLVDRLAALGLGDSARCIGPLPHAEAMQAQANAGALLLLCWPDPEDVGSVPYKMFEYAASGKPVLVVGAPPGSDVERMAAAAPGFFVESDPRRLAERIRELQQHAGHAPWHRAGAARPGMPPERDMASRFAALLDSLAAPAGAQEPERS